MQYVTLGKTGLQVAPISFGGIPIQRHDEENVVKIVDKMVELGVNYIDTAKAYTVSEEWLGKALAGRRDKFILASKSMARTYDGMMHDIDDSLAKLQTNYIDLYQVHNCPEADLEKVFAEDGAYKALLDAKAQGKIGHIGITMHLVEAVQAMLDKYPDKFETVMYPFNIVEDQGIGVLKAAKALGMGTIAMKPFAGGNLDNADLALRYIVLSGICDIAIPGAATPEEMEQNAKVMDHLVPFTQEELDEMDKIRKELGTQFCRRCGYCQPCTVGIKIPLAFLYRNYVYRYNLPEWAQKRYDDTMPVPASACIECGVCETRCPYQLPIREMMKDASRIFDKKE